MRFVKSAFPLALMLLPSLASAQTYPNPTFAPFPMTGAVARPYVPRAQETLRVTDFIPVGTNPATTDVSTYFQAAATAACALSPTGAKIIVPAGTYIAHDVNNTCGNLWVGAGTGGVGSSNQLATSLITPGSTTIKYGTATTYFMQWRVAGFPSFQSKLHINGGGITNMQLIDGTSTATALISEGTQDWQAGYLTINGAYNGVFMKGVEFPVTTHISMWGTRNKNYEIVGDLTGQTVSGTSCTTASGDCSTRNDGWYGDYLNNIDNLNTNTVFTITGFVATTTLSHTTGEGPSIGMNMTCPAGLNANMSQCPSFGRFDDIQIENFSAYGVFITDSINNYFDHLYSVGIGSGTTYQNAVYSSTVNYSASSVPPGRLMVTNSQLFATYRDCAFIGGTQYDITFINNDVSGCNIANNNYNGLNFAGTLQNIKVMGNTMGEVDGYGGAFPLARAVVLGSGVFNAIVTDNIMQPSGGVGYATWNGSSYTQVSPISDASTNPQLIHISGNTGQNPLPTLSACGSGAGVGNGYQDSDFVINVGSGVSTSCTVTWGVIQPVTPVCTVSAVAGSSNLAVSIGAPTTTGATVQSASTLNGSYEVRCSNMGK